MLTTNLLPPQEKTVIEWEKAQRVVRYFSFVFSLVFIIGVVFLLPSFLPAFFEEKELERSLLIERNASQKLGVGESLNRAKHLKAILASVRRQAAKPLTASSFLIELLKESDSDIDLTSISLEKDGSVRMAGNARTRRGLLDFERRLRDSGKLQEISSPLSNLIRETDINFTIRGKINVKYSF